MSNLNKPDYSLPFFAYGMLKPNELAFSQIERFVFDYKKSKLLDYYLGILDGAAIAIKKEDSIENKIMEKNVDHINGFTIVFKKGQEIDAYKIINTLENIPNEENKNDVSNYEWTTVIIDNRKYNCLCAKKEIQNHCKIATHLHCTWRSNKDIMFTINMLYLYNNYFKKYISSFYNPSIYLDESYELEKIGNKLDPLFEIQMAYISLYSIFNRYYKFKIATNNDSPPNAVSRKMYKIYETNGCKAYSKGIIKPSNKTYSNTFGKNENTFAMYFYYIRCNAVHRGKGSMPNDFEILKNGFIDLYFYFIKILSKEGIMQDFYNYPYPKQILNEMETLYQEHLPK